MKKKYYTIFGCVLLASMLTACVEQYDVYDYPHDRLGFAYETDPSGPGHKDSIRRFSFVYMDQAVVSDTVWVRMETSGFLSDRHRPFMVEQLPVDGKDKDGKPLVDAQPGVHYIEFSDEDLVEKMVVKAGQNHAMLPVVVKREDPFIKNACVYLRLRLKENGFFKESFLSDRFYTIEITDQLIQPACWDIVRHYFGGEYGKVKFRFMIDSATWVINDHWFETHFGSYENVDMGYTAYLSKFYTNRLIELNRDRREQGLDVLKEDDGTIVQFVNNGDLQPYI